MAKTPSAGTPKKKEKKKTSTEPAREKENQDTTKQTQWTKTSDSIMCDTLLVQKNNGFQTDNGGFQAALWNEVKNTLKGTEKTDGGTEKSVLAVKVRYDTLKCQHRSFKEAMNLSGAG
uniref:Myb/SANT-like domain-containing protein n=1 Tax=Moniliophthora roreri TaxID=221103 RepID=A0A0W0FZ26_MONRR